jgi:transcriptional regulator with XRE-family HTH domain
MRSVRSDDYRRILEILIRARVRSGLTQQQLAKRIRKPQSFVSKYENGERRLDVAEFIWLMKALRADPREAIDELFGRNS